MKKTLFVLVLLALGGGSAYYYFYVYQKTGPTPTVTTAQISRGDVIETVGATGTLQAVTTVQVGTQVSGTIQSLYADFNSLVTKGQVLARLDPSLFQTQIEQARANLIRAQAEVERLKVTLDDARTKLTRAEGLWGRQLIPRSELETAQVTVRSSEAQLRSAEAQVTQAQASLNQNEVNLQHTVIEAPIDGLVISRNVDVGQTVAASMQAPTLFVLAADLTKMQCLANLDESDVGRIRPGQQVTFRVDAYPTEDFTGTVSQVRLEPKVQQNVVTYATVIDVPNNQLKLKPGMTANVNIEIARSSDVLRVPNAAIRFRPTNEIFVALGQAPDPRPGDGGGGRGGSGERLQGPAGAGADQNGESLAPRRGGPATSLESERAGRGRSLASPPAESAGGAGDRRAAEAGGGRRGGGPGIDNGARGRFEERLKGLSEEERGRILARLRERGFPEVPAAAPRTSPGLDRTASAPAATARRDGATTIDALFGPLARAESTGRVWVYVEKQLKPLRVRLGISDGQTTELLEGDLQEGVEVVTNVTTGAETRPPVSAFPFMGGRGFGPGGFPGGGFPGGGFPGGGGGGGGGGGRGR
jgi:HlyD family secretion protein